MIEKLTVKNFEGIEQAELQLGKVTMLWGANGAGKSSLKDAIDFALLGDPLRGGTLADVVRQGAKGADAEVVLAGTDGKKPMTLWRHRTKSAGAVFVHGVETKAAEAEGIIRERLGAGPAAIAAALRAGAILELEPAKLQALLTGLTGATVDAAAIRQAFEAAVIEAAKRSGLSLPSALEQFAPCATAAEGARKLAKRQLADRQADLERTPAGSTGDRGQLEQQLRDLQQRREKAIAAGAHDAGAREERIRSLQEQIQKLAAAEKPAADGAGAEAAEAKLATARAESSRIAGELAAEERRLVDAKKAADGFGDADRARLQRAEETGKQLAEAQKAEAEARGHLERLELEGKAKKALIERLPKAGCMGPCPVLPETECPLHDLSALEAKLKAARDDVGTRYREAKKEHAKAEKALDAARAEHEELKASCERSKAAEVAGLLEAKATELRQEGQKLDGRIAELAPRAEQLRAARQAWSAWTKATEQRQKLEADLAAVPAAQPAGEDVSTVDAEIARVRSALDGMAQSERRAAADRAVKQAQQAVEDADAVAKACGPNGVKSKLLASAVGPFLATANEALARLAPGYQVALSDSFELMVGRGSVMLRPQQLSDGEQTRLRYVLQYAVCKLAGFRLLVLDRAELLDDSGKKALKQLAGACAAEGVQVLMLSCAPAPETVPAGVSAYVVEAGRVRAVGQKAA